MNRIILFFTFLLIFQLSLPAQGPRFGLTLNEVTVSGSPSVHSFVVGLSGSKWLILGGRTDGLHLRRPFEAFLESENNIEISVLDVDSQLVWTASVSSLPTGMKEQLQSTNMEFEQVGNTLYIIGGYGYSTTAGDHITFPNLTAVDVDGAIGAVIAGTSVSPYFRQITDNNLKVTGGYLDHLDGTFYLAGGQNFVGRYNPMGPAHGPGFIQEYTNEIRTFSITDDGVTMSLSGYHAINDTMNLHRRDYNMSPQIFPDGTSGFTMFSGVFQHNVDLPWLNTVDVRDDTFSVVPGFNQYLNQYHSAHVPIFDSSANEMSTVFFGGIARYTLNDTGYLVDDPDVPFVKTISCVMRYGDGTMAEYKIAPEMPGFMGSSAEFIPDNAVAWFSNDILDLKALPATSVRIGWIYGGIESSEENIFFVNDGTQSNASSRIFEVWLDKTTTGRSDLPFEGRNLFQLDVSPNPVKGKVEIAFELPIKQHVIINVNDINGRLVKNLLDKSSRSGKHRIKADLSDLPGGAYIISISNGQYSRATKIVIF